MSVYQSFRKILRRSMSERVFFMYMPFKGEEGLNKCEVVTVFIFGCFSFAPSYLRLLRCNEWFYRIKPEDQIFWHILISPCVNYYNVRTMRTVNLIVITAGERKAKRA